MMEFSRLCKAEFIKIRHSGIYFFHLLCAVLASVVFVTYYLAAGWSVESRISGFTEAVGIVLPVVVSIVCARGVELEETSHFQTFLGTSERKISAFLAKWIVFCLLALTAVAGAVTLFAAGERLFFNNNEIPFKVYLTEILLLWGGSIPLYLEHLFWNLRFSKAVSMGVSVVQLLVSALFLTGLGEGRWQYVPASWSARGSMVYLTWIFRPDVRAQMGGQLYRMGGACMLIGLMICAIIVLWFHFYEGRHDND